MRTLLIAVDFALL